MLRPAALALTLVALVPAVGQAETSAAMKGIVAGAVQRARRSIAVGVTVGGGVAYLPSPERAEYPISFGLGVDLFKIPIVPDLARVREIVIERTKERVAERVKDQMLAGNTPSGDEITQLAHQIGDEIAAEVMGEMSAHPKLVEKPRLAVDLEGAYLPRAKVWQLRLTAGFGISYVTLGPTIVVNLTSPRGLLLGGELATHLLPTHGSRSPVIDLFVRFDAGVTSASKHANQVTFGTRLLLDFL